jgi:hypothetical protein
MRYEHRQDTKTSNKLEVGVVQLRTFSLTEGASTICHVKRPPITPSLPCVRGRGVWWRFGRQNRHWAGTGRCRERRRSPIR